MQILIDKEPTKMFKKEGKEYEKGQTLWCKIDKGKESSGKNATLCKRAHIKAKKHTLKRHFSINPC